MGDDEMLLKRLGDLVGRDENGIGDDLATDTVAVVCADIIVVPKDDGCLMVFDLLEVHDAKSAAVCGLNKGRAPVPITMPVLRR